MKIASLLVLMAFFMPHEYHVSIYEIEITASSLNLTQKLFVDDFERAFRKAGQEIHIGDDLSEENVSQAMQAYVLSHFDIKTDNGTLDLEFLGAEWDEDLHTIYLFWEAPLKEVPEELEIENSIFLEVSPEQQNMHYIKWRQKKADLLLEKGRRSGKIMLD